MNDRIADELGHFIRAAVDARAWPQRSVARDVAHGTADLVKELLSCLRVGAGGEAVVAGERSRAADFVHQVFQFSPIRLCIRHIEWSRVVRWRVRGVFLRVKSVAEAEFVAQRIGARGNQTAVLALPTEAP